MITGCLLSSYVLKTHGFVAVDQEEHPFEYDIFGCGYEQKAIQDTHWQKDEPLKYE